MSRRNYSKFTGWRDPIALEEKLYTRLMKMILAIAFATVASASEPATKPVAQADAAARQRILERDVTSLLYQYATVMAEKGADPLKTFEPKNPYFLGYLLFKKGDHDKARPYFEQAIAEGTFTPASRYMLSYVNLTRFRLDGSGDLDAIQAQLERAIAEDPEYSSPYYLRGIIRWVHKGQAKEALADVAKAAALSSGTCRRLSDPKEIESSWRRDGKEELPGLDKIRQDCAKTAGR